MLPPLPRCSGWAYSSLIPPSCISLPRMGYRVGLHIVLFEACSAFTRVAACTLALSPIRDTLIEGFSHFVASMTAPIASGWSESPGGTYTHWKAPPCHGAPPKRSFASIDSNAGPCPFPAIAAETEQRQSGGNAFVRVSEITLLGHTPARRLREENHEISGERGAADHCKTTKPHRYISGCSSDRDDHGC